MVAASELLTWIGNQPALQERLRAGATVAVVDCGRGDIVVSLAAAFPASVFAGFGAIPAEIAVARMSAALHGVSARVTFEVAPAFACRGDGYDLLLVDRRGWRLRLADGAGHDR